MGHSRKRTKSGSHQEFACICPSHVAFDGSKRLLVKSKPDQWQETWQGSQMPSFEPLSHSGQICEVLKDC